MTTVESIGQPESQLPALEEVGPGPSGGLLEVPVGVILAAGSSSRLGGVPKPLARVAGVTLLERAVSTFGRGAHRRRRRPRERERPRIRRAASPRRRAGGERRLRAGQRLLGARGRASGGRSLPGGDGRPRRRWRGRDPPAGEPRRLRARRRLETANAWTSRRPTPRRGRTAARRYLEDAAAEHGERGTQVRLPQRGLSRASRGTALPSVCVVRRSGRLCLVRCRHELQRAPTEWLVSRASGRSPVGGAHG